MESYLNENPLENGLDYLKYPCAALLTFNKFPGEKNSPNCLHCSSVAYFAGMIYLDTVGI